MAKLNRIKLSAITFFYNKKKTTRETDNAGASVNYASSNIVAMLVELHSIMEAYGQSNLSRSSDVGLTLYCDWSCVIALLLLSCHSDMLGYTLIE